jgi:transketolase
MGIAEANMIGTAAGLSFTGKIPFLCSFGCFLTGRYDIIRLSVAYSQANVRLVGTHAGVGIGDDGHSQMGLEDISLMRALPTMGVFQPSDGPETEKIVEYLVKQWKGPAYLRLTRQNLPDLVPVNSQYNPLKIQLIRGEKYSDTILFASGATLAEAVNAHDTLKTKGITSSVYNVPCLKPFDEISTADVISKSKTVITVEDHSVIGGLGTCVAETMAKNQLAKSFQMLGIQDLFGESGEGPELYEKFGISANAIVQSVNSINK